MHDILLRLGQTLFGLICCQCLFFSISAHASSWEKDPDYLSGIESQNNHQYDKARARFQNASENGNGLADFSLARMYELGNGVPASQQTACEYFRKAAMREIPFAQQKFGHCLQHNQWANLKNTTLDPSFNLPSTWYIKSANNGLHSAWCDYGQLFNDTKWQPNDIQTTLKYCTAAAKQSALPAQIVLGDIYSAHGAKYFDADQANFWYTQAANAGSAIASYRLALLLKAYSHNPEVGAKLRQQSLHWMHVSATKGYPPAYHPLALYSWEKLMLNEGNASELLAQSYVWNQLALKQIPSDSASKLQTYINQEMPPEWKPDLDKKVANFVSIEARTIF
ncbi:tetratricopeptide repeat protein [Echinimonas agarilytica]|uniref:Sel1 repeat family protein n=1 Tax=Echinimonas agarilytica TaxID=1215918 RepID=A0AA41W3H9_9GAMM|nr:tetratricopeptide repeat protein [Echinimonas agarilytica]MCM2678141.1 sel1 repeat family protein [Echinimonas agarilytica]